MIRSKWLELETYCLLPAWCGQSYFEESWLCDLILRNYFKVPCRAKKIRVIISDRPLQGYGYKVLHATGGCSLAFMTSEGRKEHLVYDPFSKFCVGSKGKWIGIEYV